MCIPLPQPLPSTTMSSHESHPTPFSRSFTLQEFDKLLTSALDLDRVPLPLISFAPSRSSPASLEWTTDLDSYVDDQHDIDALDQPFLNLDGLSVDLGKSQSRPTLLRKVKSRATALVRRGKDDSYLPPVTETDLEDLAETPSPPVRVRTKSLPLQVFSSRKSKDLSSSVEPHVRRPCRSFIEHSVSHHHFWRQSLALHSPVISFGPRPTPHLRKCPRPSPLRLSRSYLKKSLPLFSSRTTTNSLPHPRFSTPERLRCLSPVYLYTSPANRTLERGVVPQLPQTRPSHRYVYQRFFSALIVDICPGNAPALRKVERGNIHLPYNVFSVPVGSTLEVKDFSHPEYRN